MVHFMAFICKTGSIDRCLELSVTAAALVAFAGLLVWLSVQLKIIPPRTCLAFIFLSVCFFFFNLIPLRVCLPASTGGFSNRAGEEEEEEGAWPCRVSLQGLKASKHGTGHTQAQPLTQQLVNEDQGDHVRVTFNLLVWFSQGGHKACTNAHSLSPIQHISLLWLLKAGQIFFCVFIYSFIFCEGQEWADVSDQTRAAQVRTSVCFALSTFLSFCDFYRGWQICPAAVCFGAFYFETLICSGLHAACG